MSIEQNTPSTENQASLAASVEIPSYTQKQTVGQLLRGDLGSIPVLLTLIVIALYFTITTGGLFLSPTNLSNLLQQIITTGVDALGVTLVLLLGEIDLSIAAVGTYAAVVMGVLMNYHGVPAWEAILLGILAGALAGAINGFFIAVLRIPSFIVTLAASIFYAGLLLNLLNGQATLIIQNQFVLSIAGSSTSFLPDYLGVGLPTLILVLYAGGLILDHIARKRAGLRARPLLQLILQIGLAVVIVEGTVAVLENTPSATPGIFLGVPNSAAILFALILILWLVLTKTTFGRHLYAVGGNMEAARRAGINVVFIRIVAFTLCSTLASVGGILAASYANSVATQINPSLLLDAIAAAVIGGTSLFGGTGSVWNIVLGALIIGSLENGLDLKSQGSDVKQMVEGVVLLFAVTVDAVVRRAQRRSGR
ncbi:MAG: inner-membrane translocator [Chloroflexi bacterium]|nr:MAG: inner-membrane translocator [Chloroflexota bacterium]